MKQDAENRFTKILLLTSACQSFSQLSDPSFNKAKKFHIIMKFKFYCKGLVLVLSTRFDGSRKDITDIF